MAARKPFVPDLPPDEVLMVAAAELFAGMGLVRAGLERCGVETVYANDIDETKASLYRENWGDDELHVGDICDVSGRDIPRVEIATASFPCVDLSLAGYRAGLNGNRSGLVYVPGFLSVNEGRDFANVDAREYAALQGAEGLTWESVSPRQAMYAFGDAVCVPVIEWLAK